MERRRDGSMQRKATASMVRLREKRFLIVVSMKFQVGLIQSLIGKINWI